MKVFCVTCFFVNGVVIAKKEKMVMGVMWDFLLISSNSVLI
jgi:hypothetical protein